MFGSSSIKRAISIGFAILLILMGCLAGVSANRMLHVLDVQRMHAEGLAPAAKLADDFQREMLNARIHLIYFVTIQKPGSRDQGMKHLRNAETALAALTSLVGQREELSDLRPAVGNLNAELADYERELVSTVKLVEGGTTSGEVYISQVKAWAARGAVLVGDADKTQALSAGMSVKRNEENIASLRSTAIGSIAFFITSFVISVIVAVMIVIRINQRLRQIIVSLDESAVHISNSSKEIAHASQALAKNSSTQAATIEETSAATTQVNSMAVRTRDHAEATSSIAVRSLAGCAATNTSLSEMEEAMEAIHDSSQRVSKIIKTIDGIAFQTNILALNAAVEAARAGSHGEGFAVVAEEVRHLAERCAKAAQDTTTLVTESMGRSTNGQQQSKKVAADMQVVTEESQHIRELVEEMQVGSREQSRGIEQINRAISELERITQSSAAQAEEGAASSAELSNQAELMSRLVVDLKTLVEGSHGRKTMPGAGFRGGRSRSRIMA